MLTIVPTYQQIFHEKAPDYKSLIEHIPSRFIILMLTVINDVLRRKGATPITQLYLLNVLTVNVPTNQRHELFKGRLYPMLESGEYALFATPFTVEFINRELSGFRDDNLPSFDPKDAEVQFFKAYVALVDEMLVAESSKHAQLLVEAKNGGKNIVRLLWSHIITQFEFVNRKDNIEDAIYQRLVGRSFMHYLLRTHRYLPYLNRFIQSVNCDSLDDYLVRLDSFLLAELKRGVSKRPEDDIFVIRTEQEEPLLDALTINPVELKANPQKQLDYRGLKEKPLFKHKEREYIVPYWEYFYAALSGGLIFSFYNNSGISEKYKSLGEFKSSLSKQFAEEVLFKRILERAFGREHDVLKFFDDKKAFNPDCYYRHDDKIFVFEFKDYLLSSDVIQSSSFDVLKNEIDKKFVGFIDSKGQHKEKGVSQLAKHLRHLGMSDHELWSVDDRAEWKKLKRGRVTIYPIIVHMNKYFELPYLNQYLDEKFREVAADVLTGVFRRVRPLLIVNLQFFVDRLMHFQDSKLQLHKEIENYLITMETRQANAMKSRDPNNWFESAMPIDSITSKSFRKSILHRRSELLPAIMECWRIPIPSEE